MVVISFKDYAKVVMAKIKQSINVNMGVVSEKNDLDVITTYVVRAKDDVWVDTITYTTIGLLTVDTGYFYEGKPLVVELIGVAKSEFDEYSNVLGSIVTNTKSFNIKSLEGSVHKDVISLYYPNLGMKHVVLTQSMYWDDLYTLDLGDKTLTWLTPLPLSDAELKYLESYGLNALQDKFEEEEVFIADLNRKSVI